MLNSKSRLIVTTEREGERDGMGSVPRRPENKTYFKCFVFYAG